MTDVRAQLASLGIATTVTEADADDLRWLENDPFGERRSSGAEPATVLAGATELATMQTLETEDSSERMFADLPQAPVDLDRYWRVFNRSLDVMELSLLAWRVLRFYYDEDGGLGVLLRFTVAGAPLSRQKPPKPASPDRPQGRREVKRQARVAAANEQAEALLAYAHLLWNLVGMREPPLGFAPGDELYGGRIEPRWYGLPSAHRRVGPTRPGAMRLKTTLRRVEREKGVKLIHERPTKTGKMRTVVCEWTLWKVFPDAFIGELEEFAERAAGIQASIERKAARAIAPVVASRPGPPPRRAESLSKRAPRRRKNRRRLARMRDVAAWSELFADGGPDTTEEGADVDAANEIAAPRGRATGM